MDEADAIIGYNSEHFDIPILNREFLLNGFLPPAPHKNIDLYKTVKQFNFPSNKLEFVCQQLKIGGKTPHEGFDLWVKCLTGDKKAWKKMEKYNKNDTILTEALYYKLLPWIKNHPNLNLYNNTSISCPHCGSSKLVKKRFVRTQSGVYQQYHCKKCGKYPSDRVNLIQNSKNIIR